MRPRSWSTRTTLTAVLVLGVLMTSGLSAMAVPDSASHESVVEATPDGDSSPDVAVLSAEGEASAELAAEQGVTLERAVLEELDAHGATDFWVDFEDRADLSGAEEIDDWAERGQYVYDRLVETAQASQADFAAQLRLLGVDVESFWIANTMLVGGGDQTTLNGVLGSPGIAGIRADEPIELPDPIIEEESGAGINAVEWGVANIRADQVWDEFGVRGEGIVVGNIDTGVQFDHPALVNQYRGNFGDGNFDHDYNWWDPSQICDNPAPCDNNNHGTHTMGTMVGDDGAGNQVGVAPAAEWIAAKGCEGLTCSAAALLSSGEFMLAPTDLEGENPRPELRPHIVNNSWGGPGGQDWYDQTVAAWVAAGMFPVFSNGNDGPSCGTAGSPADGPDAWAVGAHDVGNQIAGFSSRGPGRDDEIRPHISAPGVAVRSSVPGGYASFSGTSMAAPHQSGAIALMWAAAPDVIGEIELTRELLASAATDAEDLTCGGTPGNNNVYGHGRLNAFGAVEASPRGPAGALTGSVSDPAGEPIEAASVEVVVGASTRVAGTAADGTYRMVGLPVGNYEVTASRFGYEPSTEPFEVVEGETTTVDLALDPLPTGSIGGTVTDAVSGHTIPGVTVEILDVPVDFSATTDGDGSYQIPDIPIGGYEARAASPTHIPVTFGLVVTADATAPADLALDPVGGVEVVGVSTGGVLANERIESASMSADGRYVVFYSAASNLVDDPPATGHGVYVRDLVTGVTELISPTVGQAGGWISSDGRYVGFHRRVGDPGGVYVHDRETGVTKLVSVNSDGESANAPAGGGQLSGDGRFVVFGSAATNLVDEDLQQIGQIYVHDRETGETELVSVNSEGEPSGPDAPPGWVSGGTVASGISADGRHVLFGSRSLNMITEEIPWDPWEYQEWADFVNFAPSHVFVHDRETGVTEWVSRQEPDEHPYTALPGGSPDSISGDGGVVGYISSPAFSLGLGTQATGPHDHPELYPCAFACAFVYDRATDETQMVSRIPEDDPQPGIYVSIDTKVSGNGRFVAFSSIAADLSNAPLPGANGPFVLDRDSGQAELTAETYDGSAWDPGTTPNTTGISRDGRFVLLSGYGTSKLVPGVPRNEGLIYVVDREFDPDQPHDRFVLWDLAVEPQTPLSGDPVEITARVKNVGNAGGEYPAVLIVGGQQEPASTVTLAPGEATQVSWTVTREEPGSYEIRVGNLAGELQVLDRAPVLDLDPDTLDLTVESGQTETEQVTIGNPGFDRPLAWEVTEDPAVEGGALVQPAGTVTAPASGPLTPAVTGLSFAPETKGGGGGAVASHPLVAPEEGTTLTHSESLDLIEGHTIACANPDDGTTAAQQFLRTFTLADFGIAAGFDVTEVTFGIDHLTVAAPVGVNLYTLEGEFAYENLTLVGATTDVLDVQELSLVTVPVTGSAPAGSTLVVEIAAPDLIGEAEFRPGANDLGETAPSYIAASACGANDPVALEELDAGHIHLVMTVTGEPVDLELPDWLEVSPSTGTVASGSSQEVAVTVDATGLQAGEYRANLGVSSNDPRTPLAVVPVSVTVTPDIAGPDVVVSGVVDGKVYGDSRSLQVSWTASDPSGVATVEGTLDGERFASGSTQQLYRLALGEHVLEVTATDEVGNATAVSVGFTTTTSYQDVAVLVERFRSEHKISLSGAVKLQARLLVAALLDLLGLDKQAVKQLQDFTKLVKDRRIVSDAGVREVLTRDANALIADLRDT